MTENDVLQIKLDREARELLAQLAPERASTLLSRAVDAAAETPCLITAADLRRIAMNDALPFANAAPTEHSVPSDDAAGSSAVTRDTAAPSRERPPVARMLLILGTSVLVGAGVALGALLIPSVVHADASRVLIVIAMLGTAAMLIGTIGLIVARYTAAGSRPRALPRMDTALAPRMSVASEPEVPHHAAPANWFRGATELRLSSGQAVATQYMPGQFLPDDRPEVLRALRFGWYLAEVRGRNRPGGPQPGSGQLPGGERHALPLRIERTATELRIEAQVVLRRLADDLGVDTVALHGEQQSRVALIDDQTRLLAATIRGTPDAERAWDALSRSLYALDAHTQDSLTATSEMQAAAYQFGRGLAEAYWALDPDAACDPLQADCWTFLLGESRCGELARLVGRLSGYFNPFCAPAIAGTIRLWQAVALDQAWRKGAQADLYRQLRRWYELLILRQDPSTLIKPYGLLRSWHASLRALQALWIPLVTATGSLALVVALITLVAKGSPAFIQALLGVLGAAGLSVAAIQARLRTAAQALLTRLRQDAYTDLVAVAIAEAPAKPGARRPDKVIAQEVRKRTLTTMADASVP